MSEIYVIERKKVPLKEKEESCLIRFYRTDIYSRTSLFQRLPPWPEFGSCTARALLSVCSKQHGQGLNQQISHFPDDNGAVLFQNNKSILFMSCALKFYSIYDKPSSIQMATETQPHHTVATKLPPVRGTLLSQTSIPLDHSLCCPQRRPPTSLMSLSSPMCSECCRRRSFLRCVVLLRLAQRLETETEHTWEQENSRRESLGQEMKDIQGVCSKRRESPSSDLEVNTGVSWCLTSPWETTRKVTDQHTLKGQKSWWKRAQLPARVSSEISWYLKCSSCHSIDASTR